MWFVIGALAALLTLATGYWMGYRYGHTEGEEAQRKAEMDMEAMQSTIQHHENTIAMQDTALDTYRDHAGAIKVDDGFAVMGGKVIDLLSHRKGDC